jgi:hypothetical protein
MTEDRYAILYSDGSLNIGRTAKSLEETISDCAEDNVGASQPKYLAKVVRVRMEVFEIITTPGGKPHEAECPCCKRPLP